MLEASGNRGNVCTSCHFQENYLTQPMFNDKAKDKTCDPTISYSSSSN